MNRKGQVGIFSLILLVGLCVFIGLIAGYDQVSAGHVGVKDRLGVVSSDILQPGLHWTGFLTSTEEMSIQIQKEEYEASAASKDMQVVSTKIALNYKLNPEYAAEIYKTIGTNYEDVIIQPVVQEAIKSQTAKYTAEELVTLREEVKGKITDYITTKLSNKGLIVTEVAITDFDFSDSFNAAIEAKQIAEQNALQAINKKKQQITEAEAQADKQRLEADANAYQVKIEADAEAYALRVVRTELEKSNQLIEYKTVEKWSGNLPNYMLGGNNGQLLTMITGD